MESFTCLKLVLKKFVVLPVAAGVKAQVNFFFATPSSDGFCGVHVEMEAAANPHHGGLVDAMGDTGVNQSKLFGLCRSLCRGC